MKKKKWELELQKKREEILKETKKIADDMRSDIVSQAKKDSDELLAKADKQIKDERQTLLNDIKSRTVELSTSIVEKGLKEYLTEDVQRNLTKHIVSTFKKEIN